MKATQLHTGSNPVLTTHLTIDWQKYLDYIMNEFEKKDIEVDQYEEKIIHFQQRFTNKVIDVVELDERNWPYNEEGPYRENCYDVNVDGKWIICKL